MLVLCSNGVLIDLEGFQCVVMLLDVADLHVMASTRLFERNGVSDFASFAMDVSTDQIIVGVRYSLHNVISFRERTYECIMEHLN